MKTVNNIASVSILVMAIAGCGGGGGDSSNDTTTPVSPDTGDTPTTTNVMTPTSELKGVQTGSFQDAAVKGLTYWTASNGLGVTGDAGSFSFVPGEVIALYIGNELLILTDAELYSTPMDTLSVRSITEPGEGHPHQSLNVLRLLQTIDTTPDQDLIAIPESFHNDRNGNVVGLNFAQDTEAFANSAEVAAILTEAGKQGEQLIDRSVAAAHLKATLEGLDNNVIDLRGTWVANSSYLDRFGETPESSCMEVGPATWVVGDNDVFLYGDELNSDSNGSTTTCNGEDYGQADISDWPGVNNATRDGNAGVEWLIADNGALDFNCGPECTLAELRGTIDDWEERCLANDFYTYKNEGSIIDQSDTDYCAESEDHNGPVVGYSEITYADRLGGDRILRVKRDFYAITAPASTAERADDFVESGLGLDIMNREEALAGTLDLTQGEWVEKVISSTDTQTVDGGTYVFPLDNGNVDLKCAAGFNACTWEELNDSYNDVQYIHVRGTNVINWVDGDTVGTLTRVE